MPSPSSERETPARGFALTPRRAVSAIAHLDEAQRQLFRAAEEARQRAEEGNRAKVEWLRAMSHELRTPLNAIGGFVQLLKSGARGDVPERMRGDLDRIERNQAHMSRLIDDVLHFARLEAGHVPFEIARVPAARLLLDIQDYVPLNEKARGRRLVVQRCDDDIDVWADEDKTRQILLNLITNALKHTPADTSIEVSLDPGTELDSHARIVVKDDGPGIPPERLDSVFEPFFQVGRALNHPVEGLGLGLTIARELARGMRGDLTVASAPGQGATFVLWLRRNA